MRKFLSVFFLLLSLIFLILTGYELWQKYDPRTLAFNVTPTSSSVVQKSTVNPMTALSISEVGIVNLPVFTENLNKGNWPLRSDGLVHLGSSVEPGKVGNSIIYGHNWTRIFGNLVRVKPGEIVKIAFPDGSTKRFLITSTQIVSPDDSQVLNNSKDVRITLYTCTGFLDSKRFVVSAVLAS